MSCRNWSIVVTDFSGDLLKFREALQQAVERRGFDCGVLMPGRKRYRPVEIMADLPHAEAKRVAEALEGKGATLALIPTDEVSDVRYRADELWAHRVAGGFAFTEMEGLICKGMPCGVREGIQAIRRRNPNIRCWQLELALNHTHIGAMPESAREGLRQAATYVNRLAAALRTAYPEREFIMTHWMGSEQSFCQRVEGALEEDMLPDGPPPEKAGCDKCRKAQPWWLPHTRPDPEFPMVEWGECDACGSEVLVRGPQVMIRVGAGVELPSGTDAPFAVTVETLWL